MFVMLEVAAEPKAIKLKLGPAGGGQLPEPWQGVANLGDLVQLLLDEPLSRKVVATRSQTIGPYPRPQHRMFARAGMNKLPD